MEQKGAIFWVPLVFAIGLAEAYRVGLGWEYPKSENFFQLRDDYEVRARYTLERVILCLISVAYIGCTETFAVAERRLLQDDL